jgi:hypothetical protein
MDINVLDFWKSETAQQRLIAYWKDVSRIEGRINRSYFLTGHGEKLVSELSSTKREKIVEILIELQIPASHLKELKRIRTKRDSWEDAGVGYSGCYNHDERVIYVDSTRSDGIFRETLIHELGHFFDHVFLDKVLLNRKRSGETLADLYAAWHNGTPEERENVKKFLGV